jgi:hypothetical protein
MIKTGYKKIKISTSAFIKSTPMRFFVSVQMMVTAKKQPDASASRRLNDHIILTEYPYVK